MHRKQTKSTVFFLRGRDIKIRGRLTCVPDYYVFEEVSVRHDRRRIRVSDLCEEVIIRYDEVG